MTLLLALATLARPAAATSPYLFVPSDEVREASPTYRYANMSNEEAFAELDRRGVPYTKLERVDGVRAPVRLTGPLHGVDVHSSLPEEKRADSLFEILDARLALTLDDFCALLARHDIVEVVHYTMYRPNGPKPEAKTASRKTKRGAARRSDRKPSSRETKSRTRKGGRKGKRPTLGKGQRSTKKSSSTKSSKRKQKAGRSKGRPASSKRRPTTRSRRGGRKGIHAGTDVKKRTYAPPGTRHPAGLAIDVGGLKKRDGRWLMVSHHFDGRVGAKTCGPDVDPPKSTEARELWSIVCEAADLGLFTYVLTPNFDKWHEDHFHMEIRGDVRWFLYH